MFLKPNHMIVMDTNERYRLGAHKSVALKHDDLLRLKDVGVEYVTEYYTWWKQEPKLGQYDWSECDELVSRVTGAGLKCVLLGWNIPLQCAPDCWYGQTETGDLLKEQLSYWCGEAQWYAEDFYRKVIERYSSENCMVAMSEYLTGECCLNNVPSYFDECARQSFKEKYDREPGVSFRETDEWLRQGVVDHYLSTQEVFVGQHDEIWEDLQWLIARQSHANGNYAQPDVQKACRERWPDAQYTLVQYTYFAHGPEYFAYIADLMKRGITLITEAQYCDGILRGSPQWAMDQGASGQIVSPLHPFVDAERLEDWMVDAVKVAVDAWRAR